MLVRSYRASDIMFSEFVKVVLIEEICYVSCHAGYVYISLSVIIIITKKNIIFISLYLRMFFYDMNYVLYHCYYSRIMIMIKLITLKFNVFSKDN